MKSKFFIFLLVTGALFSSQIWAHTTGHSHKHDLTTCANIANGEVIKHPPLQIFDIWQSESTKFSSRFQKKMNAAKQHLQEDLEEHVIVEGSKDSLILQQMQKVNDTLPSIQRAYDRLNNPNQKSTYYHQIYQSIWAFLVLHSHEVMEAQSVPKKKLGRYFKIFQAIVEFDENRPSYSFYKIKRVIEGEFDLIHFINCR